MNPFLIAAMIIAAAALIILLLSYGCFRLGFAARRPKKLDPEAIDLPVGKIYEPFYPDMERWTREVRAMKHEEFKIRSFDGLDLYGKYYELAPGAPVEVMFHGYRGNAERDLSGGVQRCFKLGRSALIVDQRCSGKSGGNVITFGVREHRDCLAWTNFASEHFGPDVKIILTGISMGASTVLMAGGCDLPENVIGILADCGFTSARDIIREVISKMKLPLTLGYPLAMLGAKIFGGFNPEEVSAIEMVKKCQVPVLFFHGGDDDFVPCSMSRENYEACASRKRLVIVPGAGHGLSYPVDPEGYLTAAREFFGPEASIN